MLSFNFNPFPILKTERLTLIRISKANADQLFALRSNSEAMAFIGKNLAETVDEIYSLIDQMDKDIDLNTGISWGIKLNLTEEIIGTIGYYRNDLYHQKGEIGYMLLPHYWGKGIMSEAISNVLDYGFNTLNFHKITANIDPRNNRSAAILKKFKFESEAFFKEDYFFNGKFLDSQMFGLLKSKYLAEKHTY